MNTVFLPLSSPPSLAPARRQGGLVIIEALVAIVVLSLGALALLGVQLRTLTDTRTSVYRGVAIRLIGDLSERINTNPGGLPLLPSYVSGWTASTTATNCASNACSPTELVKYDIDKWKENVKRTLPEGRASVFTATSETSSTNRRLLGVMVAWRENERGAGNDYLNALKATNPGTGTNYECESGFTCHFQYIGPLQRCVPSYVGSYQSGPGPGSATIIPAICPD